MLKEAEIAAPTPSKRKKCREGNGLAATIEKQRWIQSCFFSSASEKAQTLRNIQGPPEVQKRLVTKPENNLRYKSK
jgi:hypothetical protein